MNYKTVILLGAIGLVAGGSLIYFSGAGRPASNDANAKVAKRVLPERSAAAYVPSTVHQQVATRPVVYTSGGQALNTDGKPIRGFLNDLVPLARRGDAVAAYRVYQAEAACGRLPLVQKMFDGRATGSEKDEDLKSLEALKQECAEISPAEVAERISFLNQAIESGNKQAMMDFRLEGPQGRELETVDPTDPNVVAWKQQSNHYLEGLAQGGDKTAWALLSLDYQLGQATDKNLADSIKYLSALAASANPQADPLKTPFVAVMAQELDSNEVKNAVGAGRRLGLKFPSKESGA